MAWVLRSPQIHSSFSNLGYAHSDGYHVNVNCNDTLEEILHNLLNEDKFQRSYRRSISFGQSIQKDLIPLLIHAQDDKTLELLIKILTNLTIPVECLLSIGTIVETDIGKHIVFEINNLLASAKTAITDHRVTKVIIDFLTKNIEYEQNTKLTGDHRDNICTTLLFLRNILHIPEESVSQFSNHSRLPRMLQNQILANLFSQNIDKVLLKLIAVPDAIHWAVTMVQLVALLYKDQHVLKLYKLLNVWLEAKTSESSEENESNTSPQNGVGSDQSPIMSSDPEIGGNGKNEEDITASTDAKSNDNELQSRTEAEIKCESGTNVEEGSENTTGPAGECVPKQEKESEPSCSEHTAPLEGQEVTTTSSNDDQIPTNGTKSHTVSLQDQKRKKIVKRGRLNTNNFKGLAHNLPTDDFITNALKEFTVDFLLKGYNSLVQTLHIQIITNKHLDIDTSHFFWLITYFLKFVTQIELDLEHVRNVLSFEIISYLTAESVNLCEQFQLMIKLDKNDLVSCRRRLHLAVTAIREFVQAIVVYLKSTYVTQDDKDMLLKLQLQMCETDQLRSLIVLLLRHYNPTYHSKQYLQDLIVTNHILLACFDNVMRMPEYKGTGTIFDHVSQFATPEMMYQFGLLLENYRENGEFVNDCVFTVMHHVAGELDHLPALYQPIILKTFTSICKTEFEICDDWTNLIEYTINSFVKKPHKLIIGRIADDKKKPKDSVAAFEDLDYVPMETKTSGRDNSNDKWAEHEISSLSWYYMQCKTKPNVVGEIVNLFKEDGLYKTSEAVVNELLNQSIINKDEFHKLQKNVDDSSLKVVKETKKLRENEIGKLCQQLTLNGKSKHIAWVQSVLLETCYAKIYLQKQSAAKETPAGKSASAARATDVPVASPVSYHALLCNQSAPLVPWNCEQAAICKDLKFLQLVYKLGFYMPVDTGKVFIRIPHFWTPDFIYEVAGKIGPIDQTKLKFSISDLSESSIDSSATVTPSPECSRTAPLDAHASFYRNHYQVHKDKRHAKLLNFIPTPGSSFSSTGNSQPNWLELIQKAQEYKISLSLEKSIENKAIPQIEKAEKRKSSSAISSDRKSSPAPARGSDERRAANQSAKNHDSDDNSSSACETTVASDLRRMYVSDEADSCPASPLELAAEGHAGEGRAATSDTDDECATAAKRPRTHALAPY